MNSDINTPPDAYFAINMAARSFEPSQYDVNAAVSGRNDKLKNKSDASVTRPIIPFPIWSRLSKESQEVLGEYPVDPCFS
jgi:hypothetical protein